MASISLNDMKRAVKRALVAIAATLAVIMLLLSMLWRDRASLAEIGIEAAPAPTQTDVTVTWFGVTTLLIDDGETQILIDGFISRPSIYDVLTGRPVENDAATINYFLSEYRVRRLAAIIPVHSHFDHAMDIGAIANRSSASILGSETTAQIGRGAGVPEDQIVVIEDGTEYQFGQFRVQFIESSHAPVGWRGAVPLPGVLEAPLKLPAPISAWREGGSFSIAISHPQGSALVQGSAGMRQGALDDLQIDSVMLGVGMLEGLGRDYMQEYWTATVTATGARMVVPIHFDDYTRPFGSIETAPNILDNFSKTAERLIEFRDTWDVDTDLYLPVFGEPMPLFPPEVSSAEDLT